MSATRGMRMSEPEATGPARSPEPPGPGQWVRETAHQSRPFTRFFLRMWCPVFTESMPAGLRHYGVLMERLEMREVGIWLYTQPQSVGRWSWLPPGRFRSLQRLLWPVHPEVRRRARAAARAVRARSWRQEAEDWYGRERDEFVRRGRALQAEDVDALDDAALRRHVDELVRLLTDGDMVHMRHLVAQNIAVGDWLEHVRRWTGVAPADALAALRGASPASVRPLQGLDRLAAAVHGAGAAGVPGSGAPAADRLARLRAGSPELDAALTAYLAEHGDDLLGFDLDEPTLREMPDLLLAALQARLTTAPAGAAAVPPDPIRARVPVEHRAEYDQLLDDARLLYGLRDDDVSWTEMRPWGLLRRALLAAGRRLVERGALADPEHAVETDPAELAAMLSGRPGPPAQELAERAVTRRRAVEQPPPVAIGTGIPEVPVGRQPRALARVNDALQAAMSQDLLELGPPPEAEGNRVHGTAASPGGYTGTARIVHSPADLGRLRPGDVLVAPVTGPAFNVALPLLGAVVTDRGGALSHAAVVAREFGIPAVVGTRVATATIPDGALTHVDGERGVVTVQ